MHMSTIQYLLIIEHCKGYVTIGNGWMNGRMDSFCFLLHHTVKVLLNSIFNFKVKVLQRVFKLLQSQFYLNRIRLLFPLLI